MRAYSNMPLPQFVARLRDAAIASKANPQVIDLLDQLDIQPSIDELETERGELQDKIDDLQRTCDDLRESHAALVKACEIALANLAPAYSSDHLVMQRLRTALVLAKES